MDFILGLSLALPIATSVSVATVTGVAEGVSYQQKVNEENANETRQLKFHVDVLAPGTPLDGRMVTLAHDRLWLSPKDPETRQPTDGRHPFTGFYLPYPDEDRGGMRGLVSTISKDPPVLNWIYADNDGLFFSYGNRTQSIKHHVGEWDWSKSQARLTFDEYEGFVAVREGEGWILAFDMEDDGFKDYKNGRKVIEVRLERRVISEQEVNKWGLGSSGNLGVKKTEHQVKGRDVLAEEKEAQG